VGLVVLLLLLVSAGEGAEGTKEKLDLIPEGQEPWTESMLWVKDIVVRAGLGYKDNVTLSPSDHLGSPFFTSGLDLTVQRLPLDGLEVVFVATGDDTRYWHNVGINGEDIFVTSLQIQKTLGPNWLVGGEFRESYINEVQYVLESTGPTNALISGSVLEVRPYVRRDLGTNWWLKLETPVDRDLFGAPLDNSWRIGPRVTLGRPLDPRSSLTLSYGIFYEPHDTRLTTDAEGNPVPGKTLTLLENRLDLAWERYWDRQKRWRTVTKVGLAYQEDNGAGFYSFYACYLSQELRFKTRDWQFRILAKVGYENFPVQTIEPEVPGSPKLNRAPIDITVLAERRLYKALRLFAEYEFDATASNLATDAYTANRVSGGLSWDF
jgi:hypothetical protein